MEERIEKKDDDHRAVAMEEVVTAATSPPVQESEILALTTAATVGKQERIDGISKDFIKRMEIPPDIETLAEDYARKLLSDGFTAQEKRNAVDALGSATQKNAARYSIMLKEPMKNLAQAGGGDIANDLLHLNKEITSLDPFKITGWKGFFRKVPVFGDRIATLIAKWQSAETIIQEIEKSLKNGANELGRDNEILATDQEKMRESKDKLWQAVQLAEALYRKVQTKIESEVFDQDTINFIKQELLFVINQRELDLQQSLAVNQQGIITLSIIISNNRELVRGVRRALEVSLPALTTAITEVIALQHQQFTLEKIKSLNETTSNLILEAAEHLRTQGVEIQKQASTAMLDPEKLKQAFTVLESALEDIRNFREQALPQMRTNIEELDRLSRRAETDIKIMDRSIEARDALVIDVDVKG